MKVQKIPSATLVAVNTLLAPHVPEITPTALVDALKKFNASEKDARPSPMLTRKQAKELLNVSTPTLDRMLKSGELPYTKLRGGRNASVRIPAEAVYELMNSETQPMEEN